MGLRDRVRQDCKALNQKDWGQLITLIDPTGNIINIDATTGDPLRALQILYDYRRVNPSTGGEMIVNEPVVILHRDSLIRVPQPGEKWIIKMPIDINSTVIQDFIITPTRSPEGGRSIGFIRLYPQKAKQAPDINT
jgi:hypothetical protein